MGKVVAIQEEQSKKNSPSRKFSYYLENPKTDYLLTGTDERGKTVYFFKMHITGLYDRVFGPYASRAKAVECFDNVLMGALESFCTCNTLERNSKSNSGMEHVAVPTGLTPIPAR
jgi:hypothetical protein